MILIVRTDDTIEPEEKAGYNTPTVVRDTEKLAEAHARFKCKQPIKSVVGLLCSTDGKWLHEVVVKPSNKK
jgi:hypothetical protein